MISVSNDTEQVTFQEIVGETDYGDIEPRVSRTATLDGGCVISTSGFSHSDRTFRVKASDFPKVKDEIVRGMTMSADIIQLVAKDGVYLGIINQYSCIGGVLEFEFLVKEKLTQD